MAPNPYARTRYRSFFDPPDPQPVRPKMSPAPPYTRQEIFSPYQEEEEDEGMRFFREFQEVQEKIRTGPARTQYMQALQDQPTAEQYAPSGMRRLGGAIAGIAGGLGGGVQAGVETAQNFIEAPYRTAARDWQTKLAGLGTAAKLEQEDYETQAKVLEFGAKFGLDKQKAASEIRARESRRLLDEARARRLEDPEWEKIEQANGDIIMFDKRDPSNRMTIDADTASGLRARAAGVSAQASASRASAAHRQATTAEGQLNLGRDRLGYEERRDNVDRNTRVFLGTRTDPSQGARATEEILKGMAQEPAWREFINDDDPNFPIFQSDVDTSSEAYRKFYEEYNRRMQQMTTMGGIGSISAPPMVPGRFRITPER